jgi:hypothetical protein
MKTYTPCILAELHWRRHTVKQWKLPELKEMVAEWRAEIEKILTVKNG